LPAWALPSFVAAAAVSLAASGQLVRSLEALGARCGMPQAALGLLAALAADSPELTTALTAQLQGQHAVGVGVLFGSNVFNIAALLGLASVVAGVVHFHRRVVVLEGVAALGVAAGALTLATGVLQPAAAFGLALSFFVPYVVVTALADRFPLPGWPKALVAETVKQEGEEVSQAFSIPEPASPPARHSLSVAVSLVLVVGASALMERAVSVSGKALGLPEIVTGGVWLAAVTSLPNAVAAVYLARAGKGAAVLSEAMNSNTINVLGGLLLPAVAGGAALGQAGVGGLLTGSFYAGLTLASLVLAYSGRGLHRLPGASLIAAYCGFLAALLAVG
jgi:cation:H+ antiporter